MFSLYFLFICLIIPSEPCYLHLLCFQALYGYVVKSNRLAGLLLLMQVTALPKGWSKQASTTFGTIWTGVIHTLDNKSAYKNISIAV